MSTGRHERWHEIVVLLREYLEGDDEPSVSTVAADYQDPFRYSFPRLSR